MVEQIRLEALRIVLFRSFVRSIVCVCLSKCGRSAGARRERLELAGSLDSTNDDDWNGVVERNEGRCWTMVVKGRTVASVGPAGILGSLQLNLEPLHANLEPIHGLNGRLCAGRVVKADKT